MHRSSSGTIRSCGTDPSQSAGPGSGASWRPPAMKPASSGSAPRCAVGHCQAAMSGPRLREALLRGLQDDKPTDPRDLRRTHGDHRTAVARRDSPGRHGEPAAHPAGTRHRADDPRQDQDRDRPQRLRRHLLQQVPGQAGRPTTASRTVSSSSHRKKARPSSRPWPQEHFTASVPRQPPDSMLSKSRPASISADKHWGSWRHISARPAPTVTGYPAASTNARSAPTA